MTAGAAATRAGERRAAGGKPAARRSRLRRNQVVSAYVLCGPYLLLLAAAGAIPAGFAIVDSLRASPGVPDSGGGVLANYKRVTSDFRFDGTFIHIGVTLLVWIPLMITIVVGLALLMHQRPGRLSRGVQFILYIPGAFSGIANFVLWLFLLDPTVSPVRFLAHGLGYGDLNEVAQPSHLPVIIAAMLIFQGVGTWVVVVYGGLNNIPDDVLEAAELDGATAWRLAWHVKLPLIRPWIGYLTLTNIAYGIQLFLEPSVLSEVTHGVVPSEWTPNQLSYTYAYKLLDTGGAAALSVILLGATMLIGGIVVKKSNLLGSES